MTLHHRIVVLVLSALLPFAATAQSSAAAASSARARIVADSQKGTPFQVGRQTYQVVVGLRAVARGDASADAQLATLGIPAGDLVEARGPLVFFRQAPAGSTAPARLAAAAALAPVGGVSTFPVVVNTVSGQLGALSGTLTVKLAKVGDAGALARDHGLALDYVAEGIGWAFLRVPDGGDVMAAAAAVARDPRAKIVEPEVRAHFAVPR